MTEGRPLRVLHVVQNFPPEFTGGTERYLSQLVLRQRDVGLDVRVICGSERRERELPAEHEDWHGVPVLRVFRLLEENYRVDFRPERAFETVAASVAAAPPDLIHVHHWFNLGNVLLARLPAIPALATFHDSYAACARFFFLRPDGFFCGDHLPIPVARCVDCIRPDYDVANLEEEVVLRRRQFAAEAERITVALAPSEYHADLIVRAGVVPAAKMRALRLGIAELPPKAQRVPAPGRLRLVTFGHLSHLKGTDLLIEAVRPLAATGRVELHLFGEPLRKEAATLHAAAAGLPVTWHGRYTIHGPEGLAARAGAFDLAVFPSRAHETYSIVVEEAISYGLPVVVSDRGAPPRRVGAFGRIVAVEDASALRATLNELLLHPERLDAMRAALPARPDLLADHEAELQRIYRDVLTEAGAAPRTTP